MSLVINSQDIEEGKAWDGTWQFNSTIQGNYTIIDQHMSSEDVAWCYEGCNELFIGEPIAPFNTALYNFAEQSISNSVDICDLFMEVFGQNVWSEASSVTYNASTDIYTINFIQELAIGYSPDTEIPEENSSIAYVFDWVYHEPLSSTVTDTLLISGRYLKPTANRFLEVRVEECDSQMINPRNTNPNFIIPNQDFELTGQELNFNTNTTELNISFYRPHIPVAPVPFANTWTVILK